MPALVAQHTRHQRRSRALVSQRSTVWLFVCRYNATSQRFEQPCSIVRFWLAVGVATALTASVEIMLLYLSRLHELTI